MKDNNGSWILFVALEQLGIDMKTVLKGEMTKLFIPINTKRPQKTPTCADD